MSKTKGKKAADSEQPKRGRGRPSGYSNELAARICALMLTRDEAGRLRTVRDICRDFAEMPSEDTVYRWITTHDDFYTMYARAREERAHIIADEIMHIADTEEDPAKARVRIDARKWWVGKANAKHYGEKSTVDVNVKHDPAGMTDAELERIAAAGSTGTFETPPGSTLLN